MFAKTSMTALANKMPQSYAGVGIGMGVGRGGEGGEKKSMSFRFRFSDFQIFDFRFLFFLEIFSEKYVGEISRNK